MTVAVSSPHGYASDADLIAACRAGDREAFGQIVRKYQAMITGLIYAGCGDLHRSEDLAQETFIAAWKSLAALREPQKMAAWLCQIARHRLLDHLRASHREQARMQETLQTWEEPVAPPADAALLSREEQDLLWRTLADIPQPYRETLVMYYRQGQSAAVVATAMETTEDAVRQRLSRGREMLREQLAEMLERNLSRSAPGAAFTVAVVTALPALVPQTAAAASIATVGKASTGAMGATVSGLLAVWLGPILGLVGAVIGTRASLRETKSPAERRLVVRWIVIIWAYVLLAMIPLIALVVARRQGAFGGTTFAFLMAGYWIGYTAGLLILILRSNRQVAALRRSEALPPMPPAKLEQPFGLIAGLTLGSLAWLIVFALRAGDIVWATAIVALGVAIMMHGARYVRRRHNAVTAIFQWSMIFTLSIGVITLGLEAWKFHAWIAAGNGITLDEAHRRLPLWAVLCATAIFFLFVEIVLGVRLRKQRAAISQAPVAE
jgi:RNA polymerase sigma factor (sigma-70 family)